MAKAAKAKPKAKAAAPKKRTDKRGTPRGKATRPGGRGGRIGNPPHERTKEMIALARDLASYALPHWAIAEMMKISEDTLERHYANDLAIGVHRMTAKAGSMVAKGVLAGDKDYVRFWLARRGGEGWSSKQAHEHSGPHGKPIEYRDLSDEELDARIAEMTGHASTNAKG